VRHRLATDDQTKPDVSRFSDVLISDPLAPSKDITIPSYYRPSGKWAHMADKPIEKLKFGAALGYGAVSWLRLAFIFSQ